MLQPTVNVNQLLYEEISQISKFYRTKDETLKPIIEAACKKLEPYFDNPRDICAALCKACEKIAERDIRQYCPQKYKRAYNEKKLEQRAFDLLEELFETMDTVLATARDVIHSIRTNYTTMNNDEKVEIGNFIVEQFGGFRQLEILIEEWKELWVELSKIKQVQDKRKRMDYFTKFMMRLMTFQFSKNKVAKLSNISYKWVKTDLENIEKLERLAQYIWKTDKKYEEIAEWYNDNVFRQDHGRPYKPLLAKTARAANDVEF